MNASALLRLAALPAAATLLLSACGGGGGASGPSVTSASAGSARYGASLLITINGSGLSSDLSVNSAGCRNMARSTSAPNISSDTTAYYTCTVSGLGPQTVSITRTSDNAALGSTSYTVPAPQVSAAAVVGNSIRLGERLVVTVDGGTFGNDLAVTSPGCTGMARSTSAPYVSSDTIGYYTCTASGLGTQTVNVARASDGFALGTASYTVAAAQSTVSGIVVPASARYASSMLVTVNGSALGSGISVASPGCRNMTLSTSAPNISTETTAYYTCTVSAIGAQAVTVTRTSDNTSLGSASYTVPVPQVTMAVSNGAGVQGSMVITLAPDKTPITVDNFLAYVNSGYYDGTVFHRTVNTPNPFVIQGGAYVPFPATGNPSIKAGQRSAIELEVNKGLSNVQWSIAMARATPPNSATSQFFINLVDNLFLNPSATSAGYAVFGSVTANTALVSAIATAPCTPRTGVSECWPAPDVVVTSARQTQ